MFWLYAYIGCVVGSVIVHLLVGVMLRRSLRKLGLYEDFKPFYANYKKENRCLKYYLKYLMYVIPILNILVGIVEIMKYNDVLYDIIKQVKEYCRKKKGD